MPDDKWYKDILRTSDFFVQVLASSLPRIISILFRLGVMYLFFWYVIGSFRSIRPSRALS